MDLLEIYHKTSFEFYKLPLDKYSEVVTAFENRDYTTLVDITDRYGLSGANWCCNGIASSIIPKFTDFVEYARQDNR